jgi:hypothetical protein
MIIEQDTVSFNNACIYFKYKEDSCKKSQAMITTRDTVAPLPYPYVFRIESYQDLIDEGWRMEREKALHDQIRAAEHVLNVQPREYVWSNASYSYASPEVYVPTRRKSWVVIDQTDDVADDETSTQKEAKKMRYSGSQTENMFNFRLK